MHEPLTFLHSHYSPAYSVTESKTGEAAHGVIIATCDGVCDPVTVQVREEGGYLVGLHRSSLRFQHAEDVIPVIDAWIEGRLAAFSFERRSKGPLFLVAPCGAKEDFRSWTGTDLINHLLPWGIEDIDGAEVTIRTFDPSRWVDGVIRCLGVAYRCAEQYRFLTEQFDYIAQMRIPTSAALARFCERMQERGLTVTASEDPLQALTVQGNLPHQRFTVEDHPDERTRFTVIFSDVIRDCADARSLLRHTAAVMGGSKLALAWCIDGHVCEIEDAWADSLPPLTEADAWLARLPNFPHFQKTAADRITARLRGWREEDRYDLRFVPADGGFRIEKTAPAEETAAE